MNLHFVTSNTNKLRELSQLLDTPLSAISVDLPEIQTSNLHELVEHKLKQAYKHTRSPVIVEDTSLYFNAWNELPGPLIKWFLGNLGLEGMVQALSPFEDHSARAVCCLGYTENGVDLQLFVGQVEGIIVVPKGSRKFGWDAIFQPVGYQVTYGEMAAEQKHQVSARGLAAHKFRHFLEQEAGQK